MYCHICGDENVKPKVYRYWSPDDGWVAGRLCTGCRKDAKRARPRPRDYAYELRHKVFSDEDDAISLIYG